MGRARAASNASSKSSEAPMEQELGSMYDYLAKIILLGPSGAGKSCILHRFVKNEWRILSSQTIGVEFSSKIVHINPTSSARKRIKLQLWDTAGTERFRSVSRSYYRGAAGAILIYDVSSWRSFEALKTFLDDARALAGPDLTVILAGNKADVVEGGGTTVTASGAGVYGSYGSDAGGDIDGFAPPTPSSQSSLRTTTSLGLSKPATIAPDGREVPAETASRWAGQNGIAVAVEVSALSGDNVTELFERLARMILTKIELGNIDPDDPASGIQYGDIGGWGGLDMDEGNGNGSVRSGEDGGGGFRRRGRKGGARAQLGEWEDVFRLSGARRKRWCC
ncbi:P-loop containing nucleoside triphosphate hydrolase protein [Massariosphaeria phaeospora]|uniref:P-loop containing nucleoside triphosphate hydrolase protein n=1 Tax=Massariosphaeria phaeospora TaxID=100035 RepID=A0A7C8M5D3_9PLEO|nr:P-loop containing nucleoside triphosphate hydrolase protein [Massariosphaeria phaeospora]